MADTLIDPAKVRVALDVGSRDGEIALCLKEHYPNAAVYAFECNPPAIELCRKALAGRPGITLVDRAVSDVEGELDFFAIDPERTITPHDDGNIGASSLYQANPAYPHETYVQNKVKVASVTLEAWAARNGITSLDVVWMDLQGAELRALKGFGKLLDTVKVLQTEVEYREMYFGQPLAGDVRRFLESRGFVMRKRLSTGEWFGDQLYCRQEMVSAFTRALLKVGLPV